MIAVVCTDGQLTIDNIEHECAKQKWIPLLALKNKKKDEVVVPVFQMEDVCYRFIVRNLPKTWQRGCVHLTIEDTKKMTQKGWKLMPLDFPRKFDEHPEYEIGFEIHEFEEQPDFRVN
jgi:hypothetical protein